MFLVFVEVWLDRVRIFEIENRSVNVVRMIGFKNGDIK